MTKPDWQLPPGVTRSLWEFSQDPAIARQETAHLANSPLLEFDQALMEEWFPNAGKLLDLGCGTGRHLAEFASRGWYAVGVDLSEESLRVAAERAHAAGVPVTLVRGNLCDLDFLSGDRFDAALLLFGTLGMIAGRNHRRRVLAQVGRLLHPGGRLALHVHNVWRHAASPAGRAWLANDLWKRLRRDPTAGDTFRDYRGIPLMFHHSFTAGELRTDLQRAGLTILERIPLATISQAPSPALGRSRETVAALRFEGPFADWRATGWMVLAERPRP